jgi:hypothetical protein
MGGVDQFAHLVESFSKKPREYNIPLVAYKSSYPLNDTGMTRLIPYTTSFI